MHAEPDDYWAEKERRRPVVLLVIGLVVAAAGLACVVGVLLPERGRSATGRVEAVLPQRVHGLFSDPVTGQLLRPDVVPARLATRPGAAGPATPSYRSAAGAAEWVVSWRADGTRHLDTLLRRDAAVPVGTALPLRVSSAGTVLRVADQGRSRVGLLGGAALLVVATLVLLSARRAAAWSRWRRQLEEDEQRR